MKSAKNFLSLTVLTLSFFLTGCYTQLQSTDGFTRTSQKASDTYYSWGDDNEQGEAGYNWSEEQQTAKPYTPVSTTQAFEDEYLEENLVYEEDLENVGLYYKDYEAQRWYEDNYADNLYWEGYDDGYDRGYRDADDDYYYSGRISWNRRHINSGFYFGQISGWDYFYYYHGTPFYAGYYHNPFYSGYWNYNRGWGFYNWNNYGWGYYNPAIIVYNDYHRTNTRSNNTRPRSTGIYSKGNGSNTIVGNRTRTGNSVNSSITRSDNRTGRSTGLTSKRSVGNTTTGVTRTSTGSNGSRYTGRTVRTTTQKPTGTSTRAISTNCSS